MTQTAYDPLGHINSITYPQNGGVVNYAYDGAFNIVSVSDPASGTVYAAFSGYNALGQPGQIVFANGKDSTTTYSYYPLNHRLQEMTTTPPVPAKSVQDVAYTYDSDGNVTAVTDNVVPNNSQQFTYDGLNRLVSATSPSYSTITFTYDSIGNITANTRVGSYSYGSARPHAVTQAGTNTYGYDANGNMTSRHTSAASQTLTYDYDNRVSSLTVGAVTTSYVYDFQGARAQKSTNAPASTTIYIGNIYEVTDGSATEHIFAGNRRIATKTGSSINYYHPDHLGGLNIATNGSGTVSQTTFYYPYGETRVNTGSVDLHYKFTGKEIDRESGLYYYGARYYDPVIGRFISADSVVQSPGDPQTLNRYSYCRNNPVIYTDPSGHFFFAVLAGLFIGALMSGIQSNWNLQSMLIGGAIGGISAGVFSEVSGYTGAWLSNVTLAGQMGPPTAGMMMAGQIGGGMIGGAAAGATAGGLSAAYCGGNIGQSMLNGAGYGALSGAVFGGIRGYYGNAWTPARVGIQALAGGGLADLSGGNFKNAALFAFGTSFAAYEYQERVGYEATWASGGPAISKGEYEWPSEGVNNFGEQGQLGTTGSVGEGSRFSNIANEIPGLNAVAGMHDTMQVCYSLALNGWYNESVAWTARTIFNYPLMPPAAAITYGALMANFNR